ncbi:fimbria/pilus periplasmic chaperone [Salmonella enterica subsp. enterica serovar Give]|nr:fimbria/pilus periplasmic chaperone [Salmonella enterica subsp. enterica serovar Give]EED4548475.1 fimbria/pilus periplasmic chaperone [Salmonella enterica subsp. enterica serovar Give]
MYKYILKRIELIIFSGLMLFSIHSGASVVIGGTRVIYPANEREVTVKLTNEGKAPVLVQSWLDKGDINTSPDNINVPFILTPPINRINAEKSQTLRVSYSGGTLPSDRESVFWLNVLEIPQTKADAAPNRLQVAFRSRIKFFYRPAGLKGDATEAARTLSWSIKNGRLSAENRSSFYVSLVSVTVSHAGKKTSIGGEMIKPFGSQDFSVKPATLSAGDNVTYEYVNDWGAVKSQVTTL